MFDKFLAILNLEAVAGIVRLLLTRPLKLYSFMPVSGGYTDPLVFVAFMSVVATVLACIAGLFGFGEFGVGTIAWWQALFLPFVSVGLSFALAGFMYLVWLLMGSDHDYEAAYRCIAYSSVLLPVYAVGRLVPYAGLILVQLWWLWLMIQSSYVVHKISRIKITLVLGILIGVLVFYSFKGEKVEKINTNRIEQFNSQMRKLEEMSVDLK